MNAMTPAAYGTFDRICKAVTGRGKGITLQEIGDAHALARELEKEEPDPERVALFTGRLNVDLEEIGP